jgi:hypothetical protein
LVSGPSGECSGNAWVTAKLVLLVSVILIGAFVIGPATREMQTGTGDAETLLIAAAAWDVLALALATALSVYKPRLFNAVSRRSSGLPRRG